MRCYLSTPGSQAHARALAGRDVLISFAYTSQWLVNFAHSFGRVVWDSGAFTAFTKGRVIDLDKYAEAAQSIPWADGAAALDDIPGDWKKGLDNWDRYPWMFPVYHDSDPPEALDAILERMQDQDRARMRPGNRQWIGLGMVPPRKAARWLGETLDRLPPGIHVHGFAMRAHGKTIVDARGADCSFDSTNWLHDSNQLMKPHPYLTAPERVEIVAKRYERAFKKVAVSEDQSKKQTEMFA